MKLDVLNSAGKSVEKIDLNDKLMAKKASSNMLGQYLRVFLTNQRQGTVSSKTRAEVSGGGRKPWKQKGTGRARHGSTRSPIWTKGGVAHGPKPRDWRLAIAKGAKNKVLLTALILKQEKNNLKLIENIDLKSPKSKFFTDIISNLNLTGKTLLIISKNDANTLKSAGNIKNLKVSLEDNINSFDILNARTVLFEKDAFVNLQRRFK